MGGSRSWGRRGIGVCFGDTIKLFLLDGRAGKSPLSGPKKTQFQKATGSLAQTWGVSGPSSPCT